MPTRSRRRSPAFAAAAVCAALACSAAPGSASEHARMEVVFLTAAAMGGGAVHGMPALLNLPPGWRAGDAAALVLSDGPWPALALERLVAALLEEGAAVLEFDVNTARGLGSGSAWAGPPPPAELARGVRGVVEVLQRDSAAGLVVALGRGAGGDAAVLAATAARSEPGDRLAAGASLGPSPAAFARGGVLLTGEMGVHRGWAARAERLCGVLAATALAAEARAEAECRRALVGPGEARAVRVAAP